MHSSEQSGTRGHREPVASGWVERLSDRIGERFGWSRQTTLFALSASLFAHMLLLLVAALIIRPAPPAAASDGNGDVPLAVISQSELEQTAEVSLASESPTPTDLELDRLFDQPAVEMPASSIDFSALDLSDLGEIGARGISTKRPVRRSSRAAPVARRLSSASRPVGTGSRTSWMCRDRCRGSASRR
ncbi:MAG: hypothetical protein ACFHWZ_14640 [Phycisphaerales bacterium]